MKTVVIEIEVADDLAGVVGKIAGALNDFNITSIGYKKEQGKPTAYRTTINSGGLAETTRSAISINANPDLTREQLEEKVKDAVTKDKDHTYLG